MQTKPVPNSLWVCACTCICLWYTFLLCVTKRKHSVIFFISKCREETEIIEGEVVEIQIDRPATGTVSKTITFLLFIRIIISRYLCIIWNAVCFPFFLFRLMWYFVHLIVLMAILGLIYPQKACNHMKLYTLVLVQSCQPLCFGRSLLRPRALHYAATLMVISLGSPSELFFFNPMRSCGHQICQQPVVSVPFCVWDVGCATANWHSRFNQLSNCSVRFNSRSYASLPGETTSIFSHFKSPCRCEKP